MNIFITFLTRPTIIIALLGAGSAFFVEKLYLLLALVTLIAIHLVFSILSANRSYGYETYRRCFYDVVADLIIYTLSLFIIFAWYIAKFHFPAVFAPMTLASYYIVLAFLVLTSVIKLTETIITVRNCLIAMERLNPVSITGVGN